MQPTLSMDEVDSRHLLLLPPDVGADEVEALAVSRFPRAAWEVEPPAATSRRSAGARSARAPVQTGVLRLSRLSTLHGPFRIDRAATVTLRVPSAAGTAYVLHAPVERGDPPWPDGGDRDGLARAFPEGLPVRDEERVVRWLVDVARRLGGAARIAAPSTDRLPAVLVPDPAAAVDLTVWTDIWLEPEAALAVMREAAPRARLNLPTMQWGGPPPGTGTGRAPGTEPLTDAQRQVLHAAAERADVAALRDPEPMQAYGAVADLELDGHLALEVGGETILPPVMSGVPWAAEGAVAYRVRWEPADVEELEAEQPSLPLRVARGRATPLVVAVTRAVQRAVGGEITDTMGFIVDPADL